MPEQKGFGLGQHIRLQDKTRALSEFLESPADNISAQGYDSQKNKLVWVKVAGIVESGRNPLFEVTTTRGNTLVATPTTKLHTPTGKVEVQHLKAQDSKIFVILNGEVVRSKVLSVRPVGQESTINLIMARPGDVVAVCGILVIPD